MCRPGCAEGDGKRGEQEGRGVEALYFYGLGAVGWWGVAERKINFMKNYAPLSFDCVLLGFGIPCSFSGCRSLLFFGLTHILGLWGVASQQLDHGLKAEHGLGVKHLLIGPHTLE